MDRRHKVELFEVIRRGYAAGRTIQEAWRAPADGAAGAGKRDPSRAKSGSSGSAAAGSGQGTHRADAGLRPSDAAQAAAYGSSDLDALLPRASGSSCRGSYGPALCAGAEARTGTQWAGSFRAADL